MTHIVDPQKYPTKKALKEAVLSKPETVFLSDPSPFTNDSKHADSIREGESLVCTNHPKRSWFAKITRRNGKLRVE